MPRHAPRTPAIAWLIALVVLGQAAVCAVARGDESPSPVAPVPERPLAERIDALIESTSPGLVAPLASDADFLRRVYLDLNGTIPDAATARAFLDDPSPTKRAALVDRLLARPQFARHMQRVF